MACKISRDLARSRAISRRPQHALSHSSLLLGWAWFPGLPVSSHAPSARQRITHEPHAPGLGHRRPCCALAAPSLHHDDRRRPWRLSQTSMPRSPRRPMSLLRAQRLSADHGGHAGRAAALPAARARGERSVRTHPLLVRARAASAPDGSQEVSGASTVGSPAARASGTRSVLVTRAVAAPRGGCGGMCQQWRWLHLLDC